ncbi:MAG: hypothetical protein IKB10_04025 [Alphaproteobacteria bacterium]|nr:hypothetical protein [Alphaproteobacteria bacterium]
MKNILKLTGVSMLAIMAASGANAAGYTCEELIEYTSCNDGYYLNDGKCIESTSCPSGSYLRMYCPGGYGIYHNEESFVCGDGSNSVPNMECTECPSVAMTDKDGKVVTVKSRPGSIGVGSCYIDPNAYFKDNAGIYHYKSNCSVHIWETSLDTAEECSYHGFMWLESWGSDGDKNICGIVPELMAKYLPTTKEECDVAAKKINGLVWKGDNESYRFSRCECEGEYDDIDSQGWLYVQDEDAWYCGFNHYGDAS